jgi:hypothetical protein
MGTDREIRKYQTTTHLPFILHVSLLQIFQAQDMAMTTSVKKFPIVFIEKLKRKM